MTQVITVVKGKLKTQILQPSLKRYLAKGWTVVKEKELQPKTEEVAIVAGKIKPEEAAHNRGNNKATKAVMQAEAIVVTETKPRARKVINTGLIKPKTAKAAK